jgi:hypothetical protein
MDMYDMITTDLVSERKHIPWEISETSMVGGEFQIFQVGYEPVSRANQQAYNVIALLSGNQTWQWKISHL